MAIATENGDIATWLEGHVAAWNRGDVAGMFAGAAEDLHWVNVVGMHWQGLREVVHAHEIFLRIMFRGVSLELTGIESIRSIAPQVRIAVVTFALGDYVTPAGEAIRGEQNRMTLVFTGQGDALLLRHVANLRIDLHAAPHDPVLALRQKEI